MEEIVFTTRLRLVPLQTSDEGSLDLEWAHAVRSDADATSWNTYGRSKTISDTQKNMSMMLPIKSATAGDDMRKYRVVYAIHTKARVEAASNETNAASSDEQSELVGLISARPDVTLPIPADLTVPSGPGTDVLKLEVGYMLLPTAWNRGYATEALTGVLAALKQAHHYRLPYKEVYVQAIVSPDNPGSLRVLEKSGLERVGEHVWDGDRVFLAGAWRDCRVLVYGLYLGS